MKTTLLPFPDKARKINQLLNTSKAVGGKVDSGKSSDLNNETNYYFTVTIYHESFKKVVEDFIGEKLEWTE